MAEKQMRRIFVFGMLLMGIGALIVKQPIDLQLPIWFSHGMVVYDVPVEDEWLYWEAVGRTYARPESASLADQARWEEEGLVGAFQNANRPCLRLVEEAGRIDPGQVELISQINEIPASSCLEKTSDNSSAETQ